MEKDMGLNEDAAFAREVARLAVLVFVGLIAVSSLLVWLVD